MNHHNSHNCIYFIDQKIVQTEIKSNLLNIRNNLLSRFLTIIISDNICKYPIIHLLLICQCLPRDNTNGMKFLFRLVIQGQFYKLYNVSYTILWPFLQHHKKRIILQNNSSNHLLLLRKTTQRLA